MTLVNNVMMLVWTILGGITSLGGINKLLDAIGEC